MPISPDARVDRAAQLGADVDVGAFSIVHAGVSIGSGSRIGPFCEIGGTTGGITPQPLEIGPRAHIRSHAVIYGGSTIGADLETGHRVTIREGSRIGNGVRIGTQSDVQGDCWIGDYARLHSSVFIAKMSEVGRCAWLLPRVVLTNDPTPPSDGHRGCMIEEYAVVAACALVLPGVTVGARALVAACACVGIDVPADSVARGVPARIVGPTSAVRSRGGGADPAYPWTSHFHRGYPVDLVRSWLAQDDATIQENPDVA